MDLAARRRACVEFRAKLKRDTGTSLTAAAVEQVLGRGLHPSTSQLNLSRVWHNKTPYTP
jgi:chorismate mutase